MHSLRGLAQSSCSLIASCPCLHLWGCQPLKASPCHRSSQSSSSMTLARSSAHSLLRERHPAAPACHGTFRTSAVRPWQIQLVSRNGSRMANRRYVAERPPQLADIPPADVKSGQVEQVNVEEEEDDDYPLWVEEDDPTWPEEDPNGEGLGFQVSNFFEPKIQNVPNEDESDDDDDGEAIDVNWEAEQYQWIIREITSAEWEPVALHDPTPLLFFAFERYGSRGAACWELLEQVEEVVRTIVNSRKYPVRAVKLDISMEPAVGDALKIKELPTLLFINGGKLVYRVSGYKPATDLLAITSHLFYHSVRPDCMDEVETSHTVTTISTSG